MYNQLQKLGLICCLFVSMAACGDKGTNVEPPKQPVIPEISKVKPEAPYFSDNYPAGQNQKNISETSYTHFNTAAGMVIESLGFLSFQSVYSGFVEIAKLNDAEYKDGKWVWVYSYDYEQETAELKLTADENEVDGKTSWTLFISYSGSDGENYDNFKFMEGTTSDDGNNGNWKIYSLEDGSTSILLADFDWEVNSDDKKSYSFILYDTQNGNTFTISFDQDTPDHTMKIVSNDGKSDATIYWDTEVQSGYIIDHGDKSCWDANFQDALCGGS